MQQKNFALYGVLFLTLVVPILSGLFMQSFASWHFVSLPLHSFLETAGSVIALVLASMLFIIYFSKLEFNRFHYASFGFIAMGIFDGFHALTHSGEVFVRLHSLAVFFGGVFFSFVWFPAKQVSARLYFLIPVSLGVVFFLTALSLLLSHDPHEAMQLTYHAEFSQANRLLNIFGGSMFILSSFYFIKNYLETGENDALLYAGLTMLFGSAGLLFFFSSLWDMQWWFWHVLRFIAYLIAFYYLLKTLYIGMVKLDHSNKEYIKQNRKLGQSNRLLAEYKKAIFEGSIISATDTKGNIIYVNEDFETITGYNRKQLLGASHNIIRHPQTPKSVFKELWDTIQHKKTWKGLIKNLKRDGGYFYAKTTVIPILDTDESIIEYLALREDVTELVDSQDELRKNFFTDRLTNLGNRYKLLEELKNALHPKIAILNIDNFKHINDFYGESFGDKVLITLSNKLFDLAFSFGYVVYRNHADEFSVVSFLEEESDETFLDHAKKILLHLEHTSFKVEDEELHLGLSAGISLGLFDLQFADLALKEAKKMKKDFVVYSEALRSYEEYKNNLFWKKKIIEALNDDRIKLAFQPLYNNQTQTISKYESLVRLIDEEGKVISPYLFLDIAKQSKLYPQITKRVLEKAFVAINATDKKISINITAEDILNINTKEFLFNQLQDSPKTQNIIFELVESEGIESFDEVKLFIDKIKSFGCQIAIDDFGTGYSNFEYLLKLEADIIKIDGSLIRQLDTNQNSYNVVESIVSFAKKNNIKTVAEFVATKEILEKVLRLGIDFSQGYLLGEPEFWESL
jgi:PAS domain S-box-containing protein/diguanylate cyclase (GGDEF)-like protein